MTAPFPVLRKDQMIWLCLLCTSLVLAAVASLQGLQAFGTAAALVPVLLAASRLELTGLVAAFLVAANLVHFLKRAIFLIGPQPQGVYQGTQLLPTLLFAAVCVAAFRRLWKTGVPRSASILTLFLGVCVAVTLSSAADVPWDELLAAAHQQLLPFLMFYVGLALTLDESARLGRTLAVLVAISSVYGVLQLVAGPTIVDRQWALETYSYSIHGSKVFNYVQGTSPEFRAYSYYADPLTWGLFLVGGFTGASVGRALSKLSKGYWFVIAALAMAGLFASMTRTCWASFLGTLGAYWLLQKRPFRRPWLVFAMVLGSFAMAVAGGTLLYREIFLARRLPVVDNPLLARYITVGTMEARISAWQSLNEAAIRKPFGYGIMPYVRNRSEAPDWERPLFSHNYIVELVLNAGLPGASLFLLFYLQWLREGFAAFQKTMDRGRQQALLWLVAFSAGSLFSGYFNGLSFMTYEFFLLLGSLSGYARSVKLTTPMNRAKG